MDLTKAYDLADAITEKLNVYTAVRIERFNFNHDDMESPRISFHFSGQGFDPVAFDDPNRLINYLEELLRGNEK